MLILRGKIYLNLSGKVMKASYRKYILNFKKPGGTSRGILTRKETWFIILKKGSDHGIGECAPFRDLSIDDEPGYEEQLKWVCANIHLGEARLLEELTGFPSIQFGIEQAFRSLASTNPFVLFPSRFTSGETPISINGLVWMGDEQFMQEQIQRKLKEGFTCIKIKIGAIAFDKELKLLQAIRKKYTKEQITLRVDANGAFTPEEAEEKLKILADYDLHSIEQPLKPGNILEMSVLCQTTPLPVALDEELIGIFDVTEKQKLLQTVRPQFIILKPSLVGGFAGCSEWITLADQLEIGWWITSALESNIGLNAIAQWTYTLNTSLPQGLGTGSLFTNNFECPLVVDRGKLYYRSKLQWKTNLIDKLCS